MKKRIFYFAALAFVIVAMSGCVKDSLEAGLLETRGAKKDKDKGASQSWVTAADRSIAVTVPETRSARKNASGPKITSNAHSADFPGMLFIWDSKQKDNGYLKVESWVFDKYESFTLTSKEASSYWDFEITVQDGQQTNDGNYVYFIPKVCGNKKINMVFIGAFVKKSPEPEPEPDPEPVPTDFVVTVLSGVDFGTPVTDYYTAGKMPFASYWDAGIMRENYTFNAIAESDYKFDERGHARWAWDSASSLDTGETGETVMFELTFNVEGNTITESQLIFAADNAIAVWVNDIMTGTTPATDLISDNEISVLNGSRDQDSYGWSSVFESNPKQLDGLFFPGENTVKILARNVSNAEKYPTLDTGNVDVDKNTYDTTNNAGGILFALMVRSENL